MGPLHDRLGKARSRAANKLRSFSLSDKIENNSVGAAMRSKVRSKAAMAASGSSAAAKA
jgi:hypothetical protein